MTPSVTAVIVAAGSSTRMGIPKQFLPLNGRPLIAYTLAAFEQCAAIDAIVVVARKEDHDRVWEIARIGDITKLSTIVVGGRTRGESVRNGVDKCKTDYVAIHDGARPLVTPTLIERVVRAAVQHGAATAAVHTKDTVKIADQNGMVLSTPDRTTLWNVQTPQVFSKDLYERAWQYASTRGRDVTDDCQLIEAIGQPVKLVEGCYTNIKVTTPEDVPFAEELLK
ncbi:MAG: 2-C-methyl-D-erythritol 4-phosphate cytidylyltransferase [Clostridia bacterium]|nr:2-C-methyl-D-erythritol 4-phosphate cytidylyltransferase [Clostridia bacterium]